MWADVNTVKLQNGVMSTYLDKAGREDASLSSQLPLKPTLLSCLGDFLDHIPHTNSELVCHGALEVDQHQHLCSGGAVIGAENQILYTKAGVYMPHKLMCPDILKKL